MVTTLAKINAGFLGLFMVQCLVAPQFLMDSNFVGITLDFEDLFIMRCFGIVGMGLCYVIFTEDWPTKATFLAVLMCAFGLAGPIYAQLHAREAAGALCARHNARHSRRPARPRLSACQPHARRRPAVCRLPAPDGGQREGGDGCVGRRQEEVSDAKRQALCGFSQPLGLTTDTRDFRRRRRPPLAHLLEPRPAVRPPPPPGTPTSSTALSIAASISLSSARARAPRAAAARAAPPRAPPPCVCAPTPPQSRRRPRAAARRRRPQPGGGNALRGERRCGGGGRGLASSNAAACAASFRRKRTAIALLSRASAHAAASALLANDSVNAAGGACPRSPGALPGERASS